jgi:hypothetical protein
MPPIISELIKFSVSRGFKLDSPSFAQLRNTVVVNGVKEQYYGTCQDNPNTLLWVISAYFFLSFRLLSYLYRDKTGLRAKGP